jgi:succinate dehydrogenase/fumarate reductase cytochrome b subunit
MRRRLSSLAHYLHGLLAGVLTVDFIAVSIFLFVQFLAYEFFEETKVRDEMYHELREWSTGYVAGLVLSLILYVARLEG